MERDARYTATERIGPLSRRCASHLIRSPRVRRPKNPHVATGDKKEENFLAN